MAKMQWKKSSPALIARFAAALPDDPKIQRRSMFGYPCSFVNGNFFTGLHQENVVVRLPGDARGPGVSPRQSRDLRPDGHGQRDEGLVDGAGWHHEK
ncbi:MAG: TfoX/Sxy family protein [Alphaproteobacteria bacterium]|nr:TfoX/Sxy family protein [Alphaproteobacteria bacterium]